MSDCEVCGRPEWDGVSASMRDPECGRSVGGAWAPNYARDCYRLGYARLALARVEAEREWCERRDDAIAAYLRSLGEKDAIIQRMREALEEARRGVKAAETSFRWIKTADTYGGDNSPLGFAMNEGGRGEATATATLARIDAILEPRGIRPLTPKGEP